MLRLITDANIDEFVNLPFILFKDNKHYIAEFKSDIKHLLTKDPVWLDAERELFLVKDGPNTIGRIAAIVNHAHNKHWGDKTGFFGFFDCANNQPAADMLFNAAKNWLKSKGMQSVRGPMNPSTNHICGALMDNYDKDPVIMMPYNPPYYIKLIEGAGLTKIKDLLAFERTSLDQFSPRMEKIISRVKKNPAIKSRDISLKHFDTEVEIVRTIYNAAWCRNWGFVPISREAMQNTAKQLKLIVKPEVTCMLEYDGKNAGFAISIPNANHVLKIFQGNLNLFKVPMALYKWFTIKDCRMIMLGVHPDYQKKGLELLLVKHVVDEGVKKGWNKAELSWMLEDNQAIISVIEEAGCRRAKTYRVFEIAL